VFRRVLSVLNKMSSFGFGAKKLPVTLRAKVAVLGDSKVGKTALTTVFHGKQYPKNYVMTLGYEFLVRTVKVPEADAQVELHLIDVAGSEIYKGARAKFWEGSNVIVLVYDMANKQSFKSLAGWLDEYKKSLPAPTRVWGVLLAAKGDMKDYAEVPVADAEKFANEHDLAFFECCAASGKDLEAPFADIASKFHAAYEEQLKVVAAL